MLWYVSTWYPKLAKNNNNQSSYQVNLNDVDNKTDKQLQHPSIKLVNRSINMNDKYLQREQEYQDWKSKMELESQNGNYNYHEHHSCLYYFCCGMYCCCCLACFCLSMCVKYTVKSKGKDEKTDGNEGKERNDIIELWKCDWWKR